MDAGSDSPVIIQRSNSDHITFSPPSLPADFTVPTLPIPNRLRSPAPGHELPPSLVMSQSHAVEAPALDVQASPTPTQEATDTQSTEITTSPPAVLSRTIDNSSEIPNMSTLTARALNNPTPPVQTETETELPQNEGMDTSPNTQNLNQPQPQPEGVAPAPSGDVVANIPVDSVPATGNLEPQDQPTEPSQVAEDPVTNPTTEDVTSPPPSPTHLGGPVTPPEATEAPPQPGPTDPPEWVNCVEDTSSPDEEELKAYEGKMLSVSALDVKHHEEQFYPDIDDPEQSPVKKIRLTWTIKGVRGTKEKPNHARVINSPAAYVDGFYWTIRFFPRGNNAEALSAYIKCTKKPPKPDAEPTEGTFSFVQGGADTDISELKPEAELSVPAPLGQKEEAQSTNDESKPEEGLGRDPVEAENSGQADTSEGTETADDKDNDEEDWRLSAQIGMIIYNPEEPRTKYDMSSEHQFNKHNDDWGWTNFHGPWSNIHRRRPGQHQALLRNDTIAMDAYVRVFKDPTQALWWHEVKELEPYWDSKSLAGYFPMGTPPLYHSPGVAGITAWLLLAPFRKVIQSIDTSAWRKNSSIKTQPLLCQTQLILNMMRKMKKDENYVNVNLVLELMEALGETFTDVVTFWEAFRRSIELELKDQSSVDRISDIFDGRMENGVVCKYGEALQIGVESVASIQDGVDKTLGAISEKREYPKFLPIALQRQKFDTIAREWKLLYNRVKLNETLDMSRWARDETKAKYTLYGFVAHVGERSSGKFFSILRPNGPGTKWLAFEDGDGNKVHSYTKRRIEEFEGLDDEELKSFKSTRQTAYLAMYIRDDVLEEFLPGKLEPYQMPSWLRPYLPTPCHADEEVEQADQDRLDLETSIEIASYGEGLLGPESLRDNQVSSKRILKLTVPPETTYSELRQKIAKWQDIDNVEKIRMWKMKLGPLGEKVIPSLEKVRLHRSVVGSRESIRPVRLWMQVLVNDEDVKAFGDPDPSLDYDPFAKSVPEGEAVAGDEPVAEEAAVLEGIVEPVRNFDESGTSVDAVEVAHESVVAIPDSPDRPSTEVVPATESVPLAETTPATDNEAAAPDAEQASVTEAVASTIGEAIDSASAPEPTPLNEDNADLPAQAAAPDVEQGSVAEAVRSAVVTDSIEPAVQVPAQGAPSVVNNTATEEQSIVTSSDGTDDSPVVPSDEATTTVEQSQDIPLIMTDAERAAADEALIATLMVADIAAMEGDEMLQVPVNVEVRVDTPSHQAAIPPAEDESAIPQPLPEPETAGDEAIDIHSETSSVNEEPQRPLPHVYGFIKLFDAAKQEIIIHGSFIAKETATIGEVVRQTLGYSIEKEFLVWTCQKGWRTAAISPKTVFEDMDFRSDGFSLIVGEVLPESTKTALLSRGDFTNPQQLSHYVWMSERRHPRQAVTGDQVVSPFGGSFYSGPMVKGHYHGASSVHISSNGQTYNGPFIAGERSGAQGKMVFQNGDIYEGSWLKDEKHGQGTFFEKRTGNKYVGGFENGKRWGKGVTYWEVADEEGDMCQICYSEEIDALFYDCGHVCACVECAKQVEICPICRKNVRHVVRMYRS